MIDLQQLDLEQLGVRMRETALAPWSASLRISWTYTSGSGCTVNFTIGWIR
jgi:hypothetical protein